MNRFFLLFLITVLLLSVSLSKGLAEPAKKTSPDELRLKDVSKAIDKMARYLINVNGESGRFTYRIHLEPGMVCAPRYNIVRHGGTMYSLGMVYDRVKGKDKELTQKTKEVLVRSSKFLKLYSIGPVHGHEGLLTVWSKPEVTQSNRKLCTKLGGTALGLAGLIAVERAAPSTTPKEDLRKLARFILFMQRDDGSFFSKFIPEKGGKDTDFVSLYYPGEAALALVMLYEIDRNPNWLNGAARAMGYLAKLRRGRARVEADHWALLATAKLLQHYPKKPAATLPKKELIISHAAQICRSMLAGKPTEFEFDEFKGCFDNCGRTCPTATRLEGLQAALTYLPPKYGALKTKISQAVKEGVDFLLRSLVKTGRRAGAMPRAIRRLPAYHPGYRRSFNKRAREVRIDYVQHALSAFIQFEARHQGE